MKDDLSKLDFQAAHSLVVAGKLSCLELVEHYLNRIEANQDFNAFVAIFPEEARQRAREIDDKLRKKTAGQLAGMIIAIKDVLAIRGKAVTCGSHILANFIAPYDAAVIKRLLAEDAIIIGKTNMDEFAMGSSNENSYFGPVKNPHDKTRIPGGSSGGSAVAVAAGLAQVALGTDTGGSIRQPAAMCGVIGMKPTYGRVSRFGLVAFASSLDQIGPFARTVKDTAQLLTIIAGHDPQDSTSAALPVPDYFAEIDTGVSGLKIAYAKEYFAEGIAMEVKQAIERVLKLLEQGGAQVSEVSLPHSEYAIATYYIIADAEASSNLARYDGARYGYRAAEADDLAEMYEISRSQGFGEEVKRRIMLGTYVLSAGYYEAYYRKAQKVRTLIKQDFDRVFAQYNCLIAPTTPTTAFKLGEKVDDPLQMYLSDIYTISVNLAGINGLALPCGKDSLNLPIGVQILTQSFNEAMTFRVAQHLEKVLTAGN